MKLEFVEVPPPKVVPVDQFSETMGLLPGLKAEKGHEGYRCANCGVYQKGPWMVWVPDSVRPSDSAEAISDQCRRNAYNGCGSGWCLKCAKALGKPVRSLARSILGMFR